jgi:dolichol-phosphate mannosyltransferase
MSEKTDMSVLIPCHNEAESIPELVSQLQEAFPASGATAVEFVFVDDGSDDGSYEVLEGCRRGEPRIRVIRRSSRGGQSAALQDGLRAASGEWVAHLDCDLQNDPGDLPWMLEKAREGYDAVIGYRTRRHDSLSRRMASRFANAVRRAVLKDHVKDIGCSIRVVRRETLERIPPLAEAHRYLPALIEKSGAKVVQVPTKHRPRVYGSSNYDNLRRGLRGIGDLIRMRRHVGRTSGQGPREGDEERTEGGGGEIMRDTGAPEGGRNGGDSS